jgi:antitoxin component YwqK of YwqJK toxin-antitoxin module
MELLALPSQTNCYTNIISIQYSMKKQIKSATTFHKELGSEEGVDREGKEILTQTVSFDSNGNVLEHIQYFPDGSIEDKVVNEYSAEGKLLEEVLFDQGDELAERRTMEYDEKGRPAKETKHYQDGAQDFIDYRYDEAGHLVEKIYGDDSGWTEKREVYSFENDRLTTACEFDDEDKLTGETTVVYNQEGKMEESSEWPAGEQGGRKVTVFNEKGLIDVIKQYSESGKLIARFTYSYDEKDQVTDITEETQAGTNTSHTGYDEKGQVIMREEYGANQELNHRVERIYDEEGNLISSHVFINGHGRHINQHYLERVEYVYFES